jgi:hypothetical protein
LPVEGVTESETTIAESLTLRLTGTLVARGGRDESLTLTVIGYVPAFSGLPDSSPAALSVIPGGIGPVSDHVIGGVPPEATNV